MKRKSKNPIVFAERVQRNVLKGVGLLALAFAILPASGNTASAQSAVNCNSVGVAFPFTPVTAPFFAWGPSAVCATAASTTALTANINNANTVFLTNTSAFVGSPPGQPNTPAGGIWIRGIGGTTDTFSRGTFTIPASVGPFPAVTVDSKQRTNFGGVQAGMDIARLNMGATGWNGHLGITGGYLGSNGTDLIGAGTSNTGVPFVGFYGALTHSSGFFSDFLLRWDWHSNSVTNANVGLSNQSFNARGLSLTTSAGYHIALANAWFIEPSAGLIWSRVRADALTIPGGGPFGVPAGLITFDDVKSLLGRVGLRVGTTITTPTVAWQPYAVVNVWREFESEATSHFTCASTAACSFPLNISATRIGTYGQYGLGIAGQLLQTGWLGYARVDYRKGDNIQGWGISAGLRYQWQDATVAPAIIRK